ncbi:hypothetical protein IW261DRAFT_1561727 [Armillaria novae-zelandiae]|uniref:Uncharacterized protein n=1 Tax=Armillaria novae-zelandiae TaxID=153914 RepID=A0AA39ULP6_9AGAR|nr:hypothetical protein IW261DRAFT_1561727 [Armillaria novae-zelandiae]
MYSGPPHYSHAAPYPNQSLNVGAVAQSNGFSGPGNFPPRSNIQTITPARYNDDEKWLMFFLAHFCINCLTPFQNHRKSDNVCDPCPAANYEIRDINFINRWVQAHPNGFENRRTPNHGVAAHKPCIITSEDIVRAVERVRSNGGYIPPTSKPCIGLEQHSNWPSARRTHSSCPTELHGPHSTFARFPTSGAYS